MGEIIEFKKEQKNAELEIILKLKNSGSKIAEKLLELMEKISKISEVAHAADNESKTKKIQEIDSSETEELLKKLEESTEDEYENDPVYYCILIERLILRAMEETLDNSAEAES